MPRVAARLLIRTLPVRRAAADAHTAVGIAQPADAPCATAPNAVLPPAAALPTVVPPLPNYEQGQVVAPADGLTVSPGAHAKFSARCAERATHKFSSLSQFEEEVALHKGVASSNRNNCLLSAIAQSAGMVHPSHVEMLAVRQAVDRWREAQHTQLKPKLQEEKPPAAELRWDAGVNQSLAQRIFDERRFMKQVHVCAAADKLVRTIVVMQLTSVGEQAQVVSCGGHLSATVYAPGFVTPRQDVKKSELLVLLTGDSPALVLYLEGCHFSPLLTLQQRNAKMFAPSALMKLGQ